MLKQPAGSNLCGQTCIAEIAKITLEKAINVVGKGGKTFNCDLIRGLKKLGIKCPLKSKRGNPECDTAIVKIKFVGGWMHWVLFENNCYHDPGCGSTFSNVLHLSSHYKCPIKIVSHIPIYI